MSFDSFIDFLFSPLGLLVYVIYRLFKLSVWIFLLPRLLPYLPKAIATRAAGLRARTLNRLQTVLTRALQSLPRPIQECCQ